MKRSTHAFAGLACALWLSGVAFGQAQSDIDELVRSLRSTTPSRGGLVGSLSFRNGNTWNAIKFGYDMASGAGFVIYAGANLVQLRTAQGLIWRGEIGKPLMLSPPTDDTLDSSLLAILPFLYNRAIVANPKIVRSATKTESGWTVEVSSPGFVPNGRSDTFDARRFPDATTTLQFDAMGRVIAKHPSESSMKPYDLSPDSPPGFAIAKERWGFATRSRLEIELFAPEGLSPSTLTPESISEQARSFLAQHTAPPAEVTDQTLQPDAPIDRAARRGPDLARYRWPIVTGGAILIGVGLFAWWRNRR